MKVVVQRVREAHVRVDAREVARIGHGLLLLVGIHGDDGDADRDWLVGKIVRLRIFADDAGLMNRSVADVGGDILAVSQFTLYASTRKGNRPSYTDAAPPEVARPAFDAFVTALAGALGKAVPTGAFGEHMQVGLVNDGPVTILLDSRDRA